MKFLKEVIEDNDGYKAFYDTKGRAINKESTLQLMFRLTFFRTKFDVNSEVNNGRGAVDYKLSHAAMDSSLVEFKLASNRKLKQNLKHQVEVYKKSNKTSNAVKAILYFTDKELTKVLKILKELELTQNEDLVLIDATNNKPSASNVHV